jgi:hypothetical protein
MSAKSKLASKLLGFTAALALSASAMAADDVNSSFNSEADSTPSSGAIAADIVLLRPLGLAGTVLGTALFVAGLPFEAIAGDFSGPAKRLVVQPAKFTFTRPLGDTGEGR